MVSDGGDNPCRHCLREIEKGKDMLVLTHRPFGNVQPYAESGPIFLCAEACERVFEDPQVEFIHVRSAQNNCYSCRIERG